MKKMIATTAAILGFISAGAGFASAANSVDAMGKATVAIAAPSAPITRTAVRQVGFDSAGYFTASYPKTVAPAPAVASKCGNESHACLDSSCQTKLKM